MECAVCFGPPSENRRCIQCKALYCLPCLRRWYDLQRDAPHCPSCRLETPLDTFQHDAALQTELDRVEIACDFCQATMAMCERAAHMAVCRSQVVACPYSGCDHRAARAQMDIHTVSCAYSDQYSTEAILDSVMKRNVSETNDAVVRHSSLLQDLYQPDTAADSETLVHRMQPHDTLSGICVKYDCSKQEILRLNRLSHELQVFGRATLTVPRPPSWQPKKDPEVPLEVLIALKKRRLSRDLMRRENVTEDEAVAYLHLTSFRLDSASKLAREDRHWTVTHRPTQPGTLKEFLQRLAIGPGACHGCSQRLPETRAHCSSCGRIFCQSCQHQSGECQQAVPKRALGATSPETCLDPVPVCNACFRQLAVAPHVTPSTPPPKVLAQ